MSKRYLVAINGIKKDDEKDFIEFLRSKNILWWHWIEGCWLLVDESDEDNKIVIRDYLKELESSRRCLIFEIENTGNWIGFGPKTPKNMFSWLKSTWKNQ
jgi:hypothetical protein